MKRRQWRDPTGGRESAEDSAAIRRADGTELPNLADVKAQERSFVNQFNIQLFSIGISGAQSIETKMVVSLGKDVFYEMRLLIDINWQHLQPSRISLDPIGIIKPTAFRILRV